MSNDTVMLIKKDDFHDYTQQIRVYRDAYHSAADRPKNILLATTAVALAMRYFNLENSSEITEFINTMNYAFMGTALGDYLEMKTRKNNQETKAKNLFGLSKWDWGKDNAYWAFTKAEVDWYMQKLKDHLKVTKRFRAAYTGLMFLGGLCAWNLLSQEERNPATQLILNFSMITTAAAVSKRVYASDDVEKTEKEINMFEDIFKPEDEVKTQPKKIKTASGPKLSKDDAKTLV